MARARNIKPGFFSNDKLAELPALTRILFAGLWTVADRSGRLEDRPKKIKAEVLPYDAANVDKMLADLQGAGFVTRYTLNGIKYIQILSFERHQNPHKNEALSTIPAPEQHRTSTVQQPAKDGTTRADSLSIDSLNIDSNKRSASRRVPCPDGFPAQLWEDFQATRGKNPLTATAFEGIKREALKAGLTLEQAIRTSCERGWRSFKAEWLGAKNGSNGNGKFDVHAAGRKMLAEALAAKGMGAGPASEIRPALHGEVHEFIPRSGNDG